MPNMPSMQTMICMQKIQINYYQHQTAEHCCKHEIDIWAWFNVNSSGDGGGGGGGSSSSNLCLHCN